MYPMNISEVKLELYPRKKKRKKWGNTESVWRGRVNRGWNRCVGKVSEVSGVGGDCLLDIYIIWHLT